MADNTYKIKLTIENVVFREDQIYNLKTRNRFFEGMLKIGCTACGELDLEILEPNVVFGKMAPIRIEVCADGSNTWVPKGIYYIDTRKVLLRESGNKLQITGFDGMLKTSKEIDFTSLYPTPTSLARQIDVVNLIAQQAGIEVDSTSLQLLDTTILVPKPEYYTGREVLNGIAAMSGGNFMMTGTGKLKFVPVDSLFDKPQFSSNRI